MSASVAVVQVGARTAIGRDAQRTGFLLRAGFPALAEAPLANADGEAITMGFVPTLDPQLVGPERLASLARAPLEEAAEPIRDLNVEVHLALDEDGDELAVAVLQGMVKRAIPHATVNVEPRGEAAIGALLPPAVRALEARRVDAVVIGGAHSDYDPRAIVALEASKRLLSRDNLDARVPGEAAAFFVLMRITDAARHRLSPLARILGVGAGREEARPDNRAPAFAAFGLTAAVQKATEPLAKQGITAGWFLTDLTSETRRLQEWQTVFTRSQKVLGRPYIIESPAQRIGYLGAAAMPLFVAMAAKAWLHGYAPAPIALATAGNDSGDRAALVLGKA